MRTVNAIVFAALFAAASAVAQPAPAQMSWKLVWSDEFNGAVGEAGFSGSVDATTPHTGSMWGDYVRFYQKQ